MRIARTVRLLAALTILVALSGCTGLFGTGRTTSPTPSPTPTAYPTGPIDTSDRIAYLELPQHRHIDDPPSIWTSRSDGSDPRPVPSARGEHLDVSPDGTHIAFDFTTYFTEAPHIATVAIDGTGRRQLTGEFRFATTEPTYSPDGASIVYVRQPHDDAGDAGPSEIWAMRADGSGERRLIPPGTKTQDSAPALSADGTTIAFVRERILKKGALSGVFFANADGTGVHQLTGYTDYVSSVAFSPDGRTVVFAKGYVDNPFDGPAYGIWTVRAAGGEPELVRESAAGKTGRYRYSEPSYSPDGTRILMECQRDDVVRLFHACVMNADGSNPHPVRTVDPTTSPVWF